MTKLDMALVLKMDRMSSDCSQTKHFTDIYKGKRRKLTAGECQSIATVTCVCSYPAGSSTKIKQFTIE